MFPVLSSSQYLASTASAFGGIATSAAMAITAKMIGAAATF
jgi:hypothetical protein